MKRTAVVLAALCALPLLGSLASDVRAADVPKDRAAASKDRAEAPKDRVAVMYFHRTQRCPTCLKMGSYTEEAVKTGFVRELKTAKVAFHYIDFQNEKNAAYTKGYGVTGPTLIVAKISGRKVLEYKNLDEIWSLVADKEAFVGYVQSNVGVYLATLDKPKSEAAKRPSGAEIGATQRER